MTKTTFTNAAFRRSHGSSPKGRGTWAFQVSRTEVAFSDDLVGEVLWTSGHLTLSEAKRDVATRVPGGTLLAVLP